MPYLRGIAEKTTNVNSIEAKIGQIITEVRKKFGKGDMLQDDIDGICELKVGTQDPKSKPSDLYETRIRNMGNAGKNGGQYYTPRPLIRDMIKVVAPKLGEKPFTILQQALEALYVRLMTT